MKLYLLSTIAEKVCLDVIVDELNNVPFIKQTIVSFYIKMNSILLACLLYKFQNGTKFNRFIGREFL